MPERRGTSWRGRQDVEYRRTSRVSSLTEFQQHLVERLVWRGRTWAMVYVPLHILGTVLGILLVRTMRQGNWPAVATFLTLLAVLLLFLWRVGVILTPRLIERRLATWTGPDCPVCGYSRSGIAPEVRCPECGYSRDPA